ncbi:MAG: class II fumarate hydratase [Campylobacter sp.]|nr:class II fumarate hydratase [Campylobacter sp.]
MENFRIEKDTMGEVKVPQNAYWGAQTERSFENFKIGKSTMPKSIIKAFAALKRSVAISNLKLNRLDEKKANVIIKASDEIMEGKFDSEFPLVIYQTGSGTQTNMNLNEVIANRATELLGGDFRKEKLVHPNDDVNKSQSSNDTFPSAMYIAFVLEIKNSLLPSLDRLKNSFLAKENEFKDIVKIGRTHLQDATPLTLGQEFSGYRSMLEHSYRHIESSLEFLCELAIGGTAVGTGINAHPKTGEMVCDELSKLLGVKFVSADNKFHSLTSKDAAVFASGATKALAMNLYKIANDIRWLASGPRSGLGEINIPANEPGSSIMPGKVNPTQCEAVTMVAARVFGNDATIAFGASGGNFELNVYMPVIAYSFLESVELLSEAMDSFRIHCVDGITPNLEKIEHNLKNSLMLVTALNPYIGYEKAALIAKTAHKNGTSLKEEAVNLGILSADEFDRYVVPKEMVYPKE